MSGFVEAYSKTTGKKQIIPKAWLDRKDPPFNDFVLNAPASKAEPAKKEAK